MKRRGALRWLVELVTIVAFPSMTLRSVHLVVVER